MEKIEEFRFGKNKKFDEDINNFKFICNGC